MHPVSCTNTHHDATDLVNHGIVKILKLEFLEQKIISLWNKNILNLHLRWHRSYCFVAGVTFDFSNNISGPYFGVNIKGNELVITFKTSLTVNSSFHNSCQDLIFKWICWAWLGKRFTVSLFTDYWEMHLAPPMIWSVVPPCIPLHKFSPKVSPMKRFLGSSFWKKNIPPYLREVKVCIKIWAPESLHVYIYNIYNIYI